MGVLTKTTAQLNKLLTPSKVSLYLNPASPISVSCTDQNTWYLVDTANMVDGHYQVDQPRGSREENVK